MPTALYRFRPYFYPRPPRGGRRTPAVEQFQLDQFLSTPSARRATGPRRGDTPFRGISIHALREEGDGLAGGGLGGTNNFYPRPPRGGRRKGHVLQADRVIFLSTPSARRATRSVFAESIKCTSISIHALREEGDLKMSNTGLTIEQISIHALREEGDFHLYVIRKSLFAISIHALREEGDRATRRRCP